MKVGKQPGLLGKTGTRFRGGMIAVAAVGAVALVAAGCSGSGSNATGSTPVSGGTAVWAEPPANVPSYIFPYMDSANISNVNLFDFQYLMYRPLYWFGRSGQPTVDYALSVANPPTFDGTKVTITLKHYMWSNGTPVTAQDVMFWLNMESAVPADYGAYTGFPSNVKDVTVVSPTELTLVMDKAYNPNWFIYNDLSQVTPMPAAWDRTASGPSNCETTASDCSAVYTYLDGQSKNLSGYVSSPLWLIVDGPWKLSAFSADGHVTYVPNKSYTGPVKPKLSAFQEVPFTTDAAEYEVMQSPSSATKIDFGYLPDQDAPAKPAGAALGPNPLASKGYTLAPVYPWGIDYYAVNFQDSIGDHAAIFKQLYFREALAYLMNQKAIIEGPLRGYGAVTVGPVAATPATQWLSAKGKQGDPFPYNPTKAKDLLTSNGWSVAPGGVTTCTDPAKCGAGITQGSQLSFSFIYESGVTWVTQEMTQLQANAAQIGIKLNLVPKPFNEVLSVAGGNCVAVSAPCNWDFANWGFGWSFSPDYLPTGDQLFQCGAIANSGGYCNPTDDAMINQTLTSSNPQYMYSWQDFLAPQLPVEYQPNAAYTLSEIANNLKGVLPQSPTLSLNPENWYFVK